MKHTPASMRSKKTRGAAPKSPSSHLEAEKRDENFAVQLEPNTPTAGASSGWSAASRAALQSFDLGKFLTQLFPVVDALWKAETRWSKADPAEQGGSLRHLGRNLRSGLDALHAAGFEVKDHTQEPYAEGSRAEVLAFQPVEGIIRPTVIETLKPTIYFLDRLVRPGQIIVGRPLDPNESIKS